VGKRRGEKDWAFIEGVLFAVRYVSERFIQNSLKSSKMLAPCCTLKVAQLYQVSKLIVNISV
jgi:hypothetical protein